MNKVFLRIQSPDDQGKPSPPKKKLIRINKNTYRPTYDEVDANLTAKLPSTVNDVKSFFTHYMTSPKYHQKLIGMGYDKPEDAISLRQANLNVTPAVKGGSDTEYDTSKQTVTFDPLMFTVSPNFKLSPTAAHEFSHVAGALLPGHPKMPLPMTMNEKEIKEIYKRNKLSNIDPNTLTPDQRLILEHDRNPAESKGDLDAIRYQLFKDKIYDPGKDNFTKEHLKKAKALYTDDNAKRLFNYFSDDDIIWMMNNIAKNNSANKANNIA